MIFDEKCNNVRRGLQREEGKQIPFCLLYDLEGSHLYEKITELDSYYPFRAEKRLLEEQSKNIASQISGDSIIVELGCGNASKTTTLLDAILQVHQKCHFVGIDVSDSALQEAAAVIKQLKDVKLDIVEADYLDGLRIVRTKYPDSTLCVIWLGSSIGNLSRPESVDFLKETTNITGPRCQLFICADMWKDELTLRDAYDDKQGVTAKFIKNGMKHALALLGYEVEEKEMMSWVYDVKVNAKSRQVEMYVRFPGGLEIADQGILIREDESVLIEISRKFTEDDMMELAGKAGFVVHASWGSKVYGAFLMLTSLEATLRCWKDTDELFKGVPNWTAKPIPYRHPFCFYYGHVAAFSKLKLMDGEPQSSMDILFSRGIDPMVTNPTRCHKHPEVPPQWPEKDAVVNYASSRRAMILEYLTSGKISMRLLNMILEHERMHQETLCYMLLQQQKIDYEQDSSSSRNSSSSSGIISSISSSTVAKKSRLSNGWEENLLEEPDVYFSPAPVTLGTDPKPGIFFWDNEHPSYTTRVERAFLVSSTPVTVSQFMAFVVSGGYNKPEFWTPEDFNVLSRTKQSFPATWSSIEGEFYVHSLDSNTRHWSQVPHKPVYASLMEAEAFCKWKGCRIMTEEEYHRVLDEDPDGSKVKHLRDEGWEWTSTELYPFPGFSAMDEYPEYSQDFFGGEHYVLKGSSPVTHPSQRRRSFRNFYQRQYPYVFAKFRCCKSAS